jgi:hypothetical protein
MTIQRHFFNGGLLTTGILLSVAIVATTTASARDTQDDSSDSIETIVAGSVAEKVPEEIEEITVYGDKPLHALRREVYGAEENFFDVFNSLNDEDEFDVRCFYEIPSFTHIRRHVCRARFVIDATSADARMWRTEGPRIPTVPAATVIMQKENQMREIMEKLVFDHPELLQALNKYTETRQTLESEKDRRQEE